MLVLLFLLIFGGNKDNSIVQRTPHYFIKLSNLKGESVTTYGTLGQEGTKEKLVPLSQFETLDELSDSLLCSEAKTGRPLKVMLYIHGFLGHVDQFAHTSNYILQREIYDAECSQYDVIVSLQWEAIIDYVEDYKIVEKAGGQFSRILTRITEKAMSNEINIEYSYLLHSKGHQVFRQICIDTEGSKPLPVKKVISCAGDASDTLLMEPAIVSLLDRGVCTYIFHHQKDRTLNLAKLAVPGERIGITGPSLSADRHEHYCITIYDVTDIHDFETIPGSMSLHRYFYDSKSVRDKIRDVMCGE